MVVLGDVTNRGTEIASDHGKTGQTSTGHSHDTILDELRDDQPASTARLQSLFDILEAADLVETSAQPSAHLSACNAGPSSAHVPSPAPIQAAAPSEVMAPAADAEGWLEQLNMATQRRRRSAGKPTSAARMQEALQLLGISGAECLEASHGSGEDSWAGAKRARLSADDISGTHGAKRASAPRRMQGSRLASPAWSIPQPEYQPAVQPMDAYMMSHSGLVPAYGRLDPAYGYAMPSAAAYSMTALQGGRPAAQTAGTASAPAPANRKAPPSVTIPTTLQPDYSLTTPAAMFLGSLPALPTDMVTPAPSTSAGPLASLVNTLQMAAATGGRVTVDPAAVAVHPTAPPPTPVAGAFPGELLNDWMAGRKRMGAADMAAMQAATASLHAEVARLEAANQAKLSTLKEHAPAIGQQLSYPQMQLRMQAPTAGVPHVDAPSREPAAPTSGPALHMSGGTFVAGGNTPADTVAAAHTLTPVMPKGQVEAAPTPGQPADAAPAVDSDAALHALAQLSPAVAQLTALLQQVQSTGAQGLLSAGSGNLDGPANAAATPAVTGEAAAERAASAAVQDLPALLSPQPAANAVVQPATGKAQSPFFEVLATIRLGPPRDDDLKLDTVTSHT